MIRNFLQKLMYGRYGTDQLSACMLVAALVLYLLASFLSFSPLGLVADILLVYTLFRMFSRNYEKRRRENAAFLKFATPWLQWVRRKRSQSRDRDHCYFKCPNCSQQLRVPKGKGTISITCRSCGTVFRKKT